MQSVRAASKGEPERSTVNVPDLEAFRSYIKGHLAEGTVEQYVGWVQRISTRMGKDPSAWTLEDLKILQSQWANWSAETPILNISTRGLIRSSLRLYFEMHDMNEMLAARPFWRTERDRSKDRYLELKRISATNEETQKLLAFCEGQIIKGDSEILVMRCMEAWMLATTGMRCIALQHLRMSDLDLAAKTLQIIRDKAGPRKIALVMDPSPFWTRFTVMRERFIAKSIKYHRKLLDNQDHREGRRYTESWTPERSNETIQRLEALRGKDAPIFFTRSEAEGIGTGDMVTRHQVNNSIHAIGDKLLGVKRSPHSFRHWRIFSLLEAGAKIEWVSSFVGHHSIQQTYEYVPLGPNEQRKEWDRIQNGPAPAPAAPAPAPSNGNGVAASLKSLFEQGILTKDEYISKLERLNGVGA